MKFFLLALLIPFNLFANELKILTWNTFLIPPPWNKTKQIERVELMKYALPALDQDIMFFQEAFFDKERNKLIAELKKTHPYIAVPIKGKKLKQLQDSGLFIASLYPLKILDQVIFKSCVKADCLSSKSAILVEVTLSDGKKVQMIDTHLQAWNETKTYAVRRRQLGQIKNMMEKHLQKNIPQILVGDLNMDGNQGIEYSSSLEFMHMTSAPLEGPMKISNGFSTHGCFKNPGGDKEWIDHVWIKNNESDASITSQKILPITGQLDGNECPLSDHYAVEAVVTI